MQTVYISIFFHRKTPNPKKHRLLWIFSYACSDTTKSAPPPQHTALTKVSWETTPELCYYKTVTENWVLVTVLSLAQYPKKAMHASGEKKKKKVGQIKNMPALTFIFHLKENFQIDWLSKNWFQRKQIIVLPSKYFYIQL